MSISSGNYTVGSGGNYATWSAAAADVTSQTGNIVLTQISAISDSGQALFSQALNGYSLHLTSNYPHYGDWNKGWLISASPSAAYLDFILTGPGSLEIDNLIIKVFSSISYAIRLESGSSMTTNLVHDIMVDGGATVWPDVSQTTSGFAIGVPYGTGSPHSYVWNCVARKCVYGIVTNIMDSASVIENCIMESGWIGFEGYGQAGVGGPNGDYLTLRNCVAFNNIYQNGWSDFGEGLYGTVIVIATYNTCASQDSTGTVPFSSQGNFSQHFVSLSTTDPTYMDLRVDSTINSAGINQKYSANNKCIRGRCRPDPNGRQSIGASENCGLLVRAQ